MLKNRQFYENVFTVHVHVLPQRFHLNGHTVGSLPQTQKLETPYKTQSFILGVTGGGVKSDGAGMTKVNTV